MAKRNNRWATQTKMSTKQASNICELSPDDDFKYCSCRQTVNGKEMCTLYDELIQELKKCPLE